MGIVRPILERLIEKISWESQAPCWEWIGATDQHRYGKIWYQDRMARAHRVTYELLAGPIPDGLQIDHLCRNRACVNPDHLEPVTNQVNTLRGPTLSASVHAAQATHCPQGHPYDLFNTRFGKGKNRRRCRACHRILESQRYYAGKRIIRGHRRRAGL